MVNIEIAICSQSGKKIVLVRSTSNCPESKKTETLCKKVGTETLCKKVGTSNKGSEYFRNYDRISTSFSFSTPATGVATGN